LRTVRVDPRKIALVSTSIFLVLYTLLLVARGASIKTVVEAALRAGAITFLISAFWWWYNKYGWHKKLYGIEKWLYEGPNLNGRWEGTVHRLKGDAPHKFVVEITQTSLSISYQTFSQNSNGHSLSAALVAPTEEGSSFELYSIWQTDTVKLNDSSAKDFFRGASVWTISAVDAHDKISMRIRDNYFTDREPPTKGKLELQWVSSIRLNGFK
jgi:hypothetical protein